MGGFHTLIASSSSSSSFSSFSSPSSRSSSSSSSLVSAFYLDRSIDRLIHRSMRLKVFVGAIERRRTPWMRA